MFESFSDASRRAVVRAQAEAKAQKHMVIGREHLALGILLTSPETLDVLGSSRDRLEWAAWVKFKRVDSIPTGALPFIPEIGAVFDVARIVAGATGSPFIEPAHLAAGLAATSGMRS